MAVVGEQGHHPGNPAPLHLVADIVPPLFLPSLRIQTAVPLASELRPAAALRLLAVVALAAAGAAGVAAASLLVLLGQVRALPPPGISVPAGHATTQFAPVSQIK